MIFLLKKSLLSLSFTKSFFIVKANKKQVEIKKLNGRLKRRQLKRIDQRFKLY